MNAGTVLSEFELGGELLQVTSRDYNGKRYFDVRRFFQNEAGEWMPGRKGICLAPETWTEVVEVLQAAMNHREAA